MKKKLTITVDEDLLPRAKSYARSRGLSLSAVVEEALRSLAGAEQPSFSERWQGKFTLAERDGDRYRYLVKKYG